ncbi:cobalt-precorrin-5B (C(1))-methyltransferase CbiD [Desulfonema magnum]|uniref:Cobalt-precorrin-5B C(1)-methyltransferase n=1 Tax=Desulfonema magnum TaxID=45655 RepID=A0A975BPL4_9BACT|nr:cobalt-precorrin-5B (C(1))-methyltransferase CbiD [Desulfonema magnum]QTA89028.1 Methyltransferase family protein, CbiD-like [Desulfonema magnum]
MAKENKQNLKTGFTTGAAATAAVKGGLCLLLNGAAPSEVRIKLLTGDDIDIPIHACVFEDEKSVRCTVIKDAGDDPDITHRAEIGANVTFSDNETQDSVIITGGKGVGRVTKPGLEIPPGEPAINPGPRKMIIQTVHEVLRNHGIRRTIRVEIFVPEGETLAQKTLNPRLGIIGGISILGTTGVVRPMSHDAYIATIKSSLSVARAAGLSQVVMTTGRRSERFSQSLMRELPEEAFIQIGDFFKMSLESASDKGFDLITLAVFFGKAVKMAQGIPHTHAAKSSLTLHKLSDWSFEVTKDEAFAKKIFSANTARHAFDLILNEYPKIISYVGKEMICSARSFAASSVSVHGIIFDYSGDVVFDNAKACQ